MKISLSAIKEASTKRRSGYEEEILRCGSIDGSHIILSWNNYLRIKKQYATTDEISENNNVQKNDPPPAKEMAKSAMTSLSRWLLNGAKTVDDTTLETRLNACHSCEFWNSSGFAGSGRCMKCGCSTWAKLRMATEKCPIGKW
jgi:hypothetical protein